MGKIALIAGKGDIVNEAIAHLEDPLVISLTDDPEYPFNYKASPGEVGKILKILKKEKVTEVAFMGKVEKKGLFSGYKFDLTAIRLLASLRSFKDDEIMNKVVEVLEKEGIRVLNQKELLKHLIPEEGLICGRLTQGIKRDVAFGFKVAKEIGRFGIGQTVAVKNACVLAVEAVEGTDLTIERAGSFAKDFVIVKVKRPKQKDFMDLPVVGDRTVIVAKESGACAIALEAGESVLTKEAVALAQKYRITLVAVSQRTIERWSHEDSLP